ncbi:MAG: eukaryotic-like serine/threonine-protein kinase [Pyrinomonadaceae bacterium]|jgi:serine/threonine protein kinase|nr:eukaryotic-like serine/threonine-protein kinase [Pyrinomonadaceae bacterium]
MRECPRCESCYEDDVDVCPTDDAKTKQTLPGSRLLSSRYLLEKRLGRGAMGQVYLACDQNLVTRRVAVKTVRPDILNDEDLQEGEAIARFEREARAAASIRHPNVVDVTDFGKSADGVFFLVMEYVDGESLYQLLRREGTLDLQRTLTILGQAVAGVEAAHDEGILHRDLKPANIFLMQKRKPAGGSMADGFVKVGDFGLAKIVTADRSEATSESGPQSRGIIGTPEYMAPEQMQTGVTLDTRADIYALGTIAYHMLGGRPPFIGDLTQLVAQKLMQAPPPLSTLRSDISAEVEKAIMHALEREPQARPQNAAEWFDELNAAVSKRPEPPPSADSPLIVMAPQGSEVYVDDERHGSVGRSGRVVLRSIVPGQHVLRVSRAGEVDDERVIEVRADGIEQIIQAQFKSAAGSEHLSPSRGGSLDSRTGSAVSAPHIVACTQCGSRFAEGIKFCGRCGNRSFERVGTSELKQAAIGSQPGVVAATVPCPRCHTQYPAGIRFCGKCGIPIGAASLDWRPPRSVEVICKSCGTSYAPGTKFCGRCGKPLNV